MAHTTRSRPQGSGFSGGNSVLLTGTRGHFYRPEAITFEWASEPMTPDAEEPAEGGLRAWKQRPGMPSSPSGRGMAKVAEKGPVKECPEQLLSSTRRRHLVEAKHTNYEARRPAPRSSNQARGHPGCRKFILLRIASKPKLSGACPRVVAINGIMDEGTMDDLC